MYIYICCFDQLIIQYYIIYKEMSRSDISHYMIVREQLLE